MHRHVALCILVVLLCVMMVQEWEGRLNVGMSNSVTTAIRESVRDMAIGKTKTTEKADRATVEQVKIILLYQLHLFWNI